MSTIKIESNYDYLNDASVVDAEAEGLRVGMINDGGATKKESRSRAWLVDAQCRAVLRRDWKAERAYEARILALDEAAAKQ